MVTKLGSNKRPHRTAQIELIVDEDGTIHIPWHNDSVDKLVARIDGQNQRGPESVPGLPFRNLCG